MSQILAAQSKSVEKWTGASIEQSIPLIGQAHTPLNRLHAAKYKPGSALPAPGLHALSRIRLKKGLLKADFAALRRALTELERGRTSKCPV